MDLLTLISDVLLVIGALGASFYCFILSKRIKQLNQFDTGLGGAIAVLSGQVDDLQRALAQTEEASNLAGDELKRLVAEANETASKLDVLLVSSEDLLEPREADLNTFEVETEPTGFRTRRSA